jgi:hypothetical protein
MLLLDDETGCDEIRHLDQGVIFMWSKRRVLSAIVGFSLLGISRATMAAVHFDPASTQETSAQASFQHSQILLADWSEHYPWHHHHHNPNNPNGPNYNSNPNDYYWGTKYRYQYAPGWFNSPPSGWATNQRRLYLEQRRQVAINMQQQMLARGDVKAAQRLSGVIGQLNSELGYR